MAKRLAPTLADYAVIAISPALIMALVGSLIFFLIEVFYLGEYDGRLTFIMAMFVMGAVLIARIAIEQGRDYALMFAIPLGIVTAIATFRFVEYSGPLRGISSLINIGLIGLIWWCANKLTWDSTVIDEGKDASGEGLLQTVGLDATEPATKPQLPDQDGTTTRTPEPQITPWQKFVKRRHRRHAPGVWVVYFSLAALPIFGFGNWFIPSSDPDSRRYVFKLLVVYVASALGLLLTTSFLGLRRYLRQRRLEMPNEIAVGWLGTGALMIVGLLVVCLILPRRNAEYSITQLPIFAGSPTDLWTTEYAVGNEGQEDPEKADRESEQSGGEAQSQSKKSSDGKQSGDQSSSSGKSSQGEKSDQSQGSQSGQQQDGGKQDGGKQDGGKQDGGKQDGEQSQGGKSEGKQGNQQSGDKQNSDESGNTQNSTDQSQQNDSSQGKQSSNEKGAGKKRDGANAEKRDSQNNEQQPQSQQSSQSNEQRPNVEAKKQQPSSSSSNRQQGSKSTPRKTSKFDPSKIGSAIGGSIGNLMKFIYWLVVIAIIAFVVLRYHREILEAVRNFMKSLRDFWDSLFGRKREQAEEVAAAAAVPTGPPPKPFASFADPFLTGMAQQQPPAEVIRYSFEAFEAWGRERGYPREPEQTPHEYAQIVGQQQTALGREVSALAELYCRCAYGKDPGNRSNFEHLRRLWEKLRASPAV